MAQTSLPNRPLLPGDRAALEAGPWLHAIRELVNEFQASGCPVLNGCFRYSSLAEGPERVFTCHPGRIWEYASLLETISPRDDALQQSFQESAGRDDFPVVQSVSGQRSPRTRRSASLPGAGVQITNLSCGESHPTPLRILDVGGAGSALPYLLARLGHEVVTSDIQPWLVDLCGHIAKAKELNIRAATADLTNASANLGGPYDVVSCISVLEHIHPDKRSVAIRQLHDLAKPGGLVYLTFDYGDYRHGRPGSRSFSEAISDIAPICEAVLAAGLRFKGNDPLELPSHVIAQRSTPEFEAIGRSIQLTMKPMDGKTPWHSVLGYVARRLGWSRSEPNRFAHHNFFRMFLERPPTP